MLDVRESVAHLFSLGRFDDVRVDASVEGGGVALRYELTPIHVGLEDRVRPAISRARRRRRELRRASSIATARRRRSAASTSSSLAMADMLRERGYRRAE